MTFTGSTNGNLIVERCEALGGLWSGISTNSPPRLSTTNTVRFADGPASNAFYRVIYTP